eukprot:scaffold7433_cov457-Prasinococcus_capsulatus_cf.AAC.1
MGILYACVARGKVILVEQAEGDGNNAGAVVRRILESLPQKDNKVSYTHDRHIFHLVRRSPTPHRRRVSRCVERLSYLRGSGAANVPHSWSWMASHTSVWPRRSWGEASRSPSWKRRRPGSR